jgi:DNA protecting protein DprA
MNHHEKDLLRKSIERFDYTDEKEAYSLDDRMKFACEWMERNRCQILPITDPRLFRLAETQEAPAALFVQGDCGKLELPGLTVVGTRLANPYGIRAAMIMGKALVQAGFSIVSGLARGIDSAAHQAAIDQGGVTIAVVGHGLDIIYPRENKLLAQSILYKGGCLVSEYPPGTPPRKHHFPARNRILSGLTLGTLVIQASEKSGALITARCALEQNREVFVIPGMFDDLRFEGNHRLIQQGGKLITGIDDIISEFPSITFISSLKNDLFGLIKPLQELFASLGGTASLDDLVNELQGTWDDLLKLLELGQSLGLVKETSPQHFIWLGPLDNRIDIDAMEASSNDFRTV